MIASGNPFRAEYTCTSTKSYEEVRKELDEFLKAANQKEETETNKNKDDLPDYKGDYIYSPGEIDEILMGKIDLDKLYGSIYGKGPIKKSILDQAKELVDEGRQSEYGRPERNIGLIADLWSAYLDTTLTEDDVCNLMALLKIARLKGNPEHVDSDVDLIGYTYLKHVIRASNEDA